MSSTLLLPGLTAGHETVAIHHQNSSMGRLLSFIFFEPEGTEGREGDYGGGWRWRSTVEAASMEGNRRKMKKEAK